MTAEGGHVSLRHTVVAALAVALGAVSLHSVLTGNRWYPPVILVIVVVAVLGGVGRRLAIPPVILAVPQLLGVLVTATLLYARGAALGGVIPTVRSVHHLGTLSSAGLTELRVVLLPTYPDNDLVLLAVLGAGLIAVVVDLVAVGARRPTFAGLPLVLLVAVPAAIRERSVGNAALLAAVLGFLLLLSLDGEDRAGRWGRVLPGADDALPSALAGNAGAGLQIGLASIALAVIVPLAVPGASTSPFGSSSGLGAGTGHDSAVIVDPLVSVSNELTMESDQVLLNVKTPSSTYLRLTALEDFGDDGFTLGPVTAGSNARVGKGVPPVAAVADPQPGQTITQTITASPSLQERLLPVPDGTTSVAVHGDWRVSAPTRTIFSSDKTTSGLRWTATDDIAEPTPAQLTAGGRLGGPQPAYPDGVVEDTTTPTDLPPVVKETAEAWTKGASTVFAAATDIQDHFTDGSFTYDTQVNFRAGPDGFKDFLSQRSGFCEQYATTMAAMMRSLGVPSRVAIGFVGGQIQPDGEYAVTGADAHAWPEVYFQGTGWVRFEPTPRSGAAAPGYTHPTTTVTAPTPGQSSSVGVVPSTSTAPGQDGLNDKLSHLPGERDTTAAPAVTAPGPGLPVWPWVLGGLVLAFGVAAAPALLTRLRRRRRLALRGPGSVEDLWAQLLDDAADLGVALSAADSPRATARRVLRTSTPWGAPPTELRLSAARLVRAVELARYAPDSEGRSTDGLALDEVALRHALAAELTRPARWWATIAPGSTRRQVSGLVSGVVPRVLAGLDTLVSGRKRRAPSTG